MKKIVAFDTLRFILALCVVFGHTYVVLFRGADFHVSIHNLAVDGFFVLSGFLLAKSCQKLWTETQSSVDLFWKSTCNRIKRLYPEYVFAILFTIVVSIAFGLHVNYSVLPYNLVMISQINGVPGIVNGSWYVSVLFWVGSIYVAMLLWQKKTAVRLFIPLIVLFTFCWCYTVIGHLVLHGTNHMVWGWISSGLIKGFMSIGIGIMTYFACQYIEQKSISWRSNKHVAFPVLELGAITLLIFCFAQRHPSQLDFLVYASYPIIISLYYFRKETITRFFSWKWWERITPVAYTLFLTHVVILDAIRQSGIPVRTYPRTWAYIVIALICVVVAYVCYHAQKWLFGKLKAVFLIENGGMGK